MPYAWNQFDVKTQLLLHVAFIVPVAVADIALILTGRYVLVVLLATIEVLLGVASWSVIRSLRDGDKHLLIRPAGDIDIVHPMLDTPYRIRADAVHSVWAGPFDQPPRTRSDRWFLRGKRFPSPVVNISEVTGPGDESANDILIAFRRSITPQFRTNFSSNLWLLGLHSPFTARRVNGLVVSFATKPEAGALGPHKIRDSQTMPSDLRAWLS